MTKTHVNVAVFGSKGTGKSAIVAGLVANIGEQCKSNAKIIDTDNREVALIDTDGSPEHFDDDIAAICQADAALLVVSSTADFEASLKEDVFRNRVLLAQFLSVEQLIVVVTKMDIAEDGPYSQSRFNAVKEAVIEEFSMVGFDESSIPFIPVSSVKGDNLLAKSDNMAWFQGWAAIFSEEPKTGFTLVEALDNVGAPERYPMTPLRLAIQKTFPREDGDGTICTGVVSGGQIHVGQTIAIAPGNIKAEVTHLRTPNDANRQSATAGEFVGFSVGPDVPVEKLKRGCIVGNSDIMPPQGTHSFASQLMVMHDPSFEVTVQEGTTMTVYCHTASVQCKLLKILAEIDPSTGNHTKNRPSSLANGSSSLVVFELLEHGCVGTMQPSMDMARIAVKIDGKIIGMGTVWTTTAALV